MKDRTRNDKANMLVPPRPKGGKKIANLPQYQKEIMKQYISDSSIQNFNATTHNHNRSMSGLQQNNTNQSNSVY